MTKTDLSRLKPGVRLRLKQGFGPPGVIVRVVRYPAIPTPGGDPDPNLVEVRDGPATHIWNIDTVTLFKHTTSER